MRTARLAELLAPWLRSGPACVVVAAGLRGLALDGRLPVGARVPAERELAAALSLSRTTVSAAYDVLRSEGYLHSDRGAGSRVALPAAVPARPDVLVTGGALQGWNLVLRALARPGERGLVVQPTYPAVLDAVAAHRLRAVARPMTTPAGTMTMPAGTMTMPAGTISSAQPGRTATCSTRRAERSPTGRMPPQRRRSLTSEGWDERRAEHHHHR